MIYLQQEHYDQAITNFNQALALLPDDPIILYNRGAAHVQANDYPQAVADYSQTLRLDPTFVDAYFDRAYAYYLLGQHNLAIADFEQVVALSTDTSLCQNAQEWIAALASS